MSDETNEADAIINVIAAVRRETEEVVGLRNSTDVWYIMHLGIIGELIPDVLCAVPSAWEEDEHFTAETAIDGICSEGLS